MFRQHLFVCSLILPEQRAEKNRNCKTGQLLLTAVKCLFFAIHHSGEQACGWHSVQRFPAVFSVSGLLNPTSSDLAVETTVYF